MECVFAGKEVGKYMATGNKLDLQTIEKIRAFVALGKPYNQIARELGISWASVQKYAEEAADEVQKLREQKKQQFIDDIWKSIRSALRLGQHKIDLAMAAEEKLEELMDTLREKEVEPDKIMALMKELSKAMSIPLAHISTYIGTLYDKQALMQGDPTSREESTLKIAEMPEDEKKKLILRVAEREKARGEERVH